MSKARELAELGAVYDSGALSNRNKIINGAFTVAQRATSVSSSATAGYNTVDRFRVNVSGATFNQSQQTVTVGGETGLPTQFTKFLRHECTTGNDNHFIITRIEDVAKFQGNMILSFYAKGSNPSTLGKLSVKFHQHFGSGSSSDVYTTAQDLTLTGTWQRFTFNVTMASITGKTVGAGNYGGVLFGQDTNASTEAWTLDITGVQLEVGTEATPFEHRSFGQELALCQRYYQLVGRDFSDATPTTAFGWGYTTSGSAAEGMFRFEKRMRTAPTFTQSTDQNLDFQTNTGSGAVHSSNAFTSVVLSEMSAEFTQQNHASNFGGAGQPYFLKWNGVQGTGLSASIQLDAEL